MTNILREGKREGENRDGKRGGEREREGEEWLLISE